MLPDIREPILAAADVLGPSGSIAALSAAILAALKLVAYLVRAYTWRVHNRDVQAGRPSNPPPELPPSLGLVLIVALGSMLALTEPAARLSMSGDAEGSASCNPPCGRGQKCESGKCVSTAKRPPKAKEKPAMVDSSRNVPGWEDVSGVDPFPSREPEIIVTR